MKKLFLLEKQPIAFFAAVSGKSDKFLDSKQQKQQLSKNRHYVTDLCR